MRLNSPQINLIIRACMKASKSLIRDFGELEHLQVSSKGPGDFVSSADKRTEKILVDELQRSHPDYGIVTEEAGIINEKNFNNRWIIDPIIQTSCSYIGCYKIFNLATFKFVNNIDSSSLIKITVNFT